MAILGIASSLIPSVSNLALISIPINEAKVAFNRMFEFTNITSETKEIIENDRFEFRNLEIRNLSFRFHGRKQILEDVNIKLNKGELIAIIGESGCGKSTLAFILQKFYNAETGKIIINRNKLLNEINTNSWRKIIGVVPQDIHIFNGNVIDDISHRFHTLKNISDRIYILKDNKTQTSGTHFSLLKSKNLYRAYWEDLVIN